jgi:2-(1,2-epoxy-1,2-dihydrophenyl)acetyl-CoA isomerase
MRAIIVAAMTSFETLKVDRGDGVVTVTMNRPEKKNAIDAQMTEELVEFLTEVKTTESDRVLVLTGAGGEFCSGADLTPSAAASTSGLASMRRVSALVLALHELPKPTIAKLDGVAAGLGANLALGCDLIVASDRARISEIFARRGLAIDGGGSWLLPRLIGLHRAKELAFFADIISAQEAERLGLVNRVVPVDELDAFVDDWAAKLAAGPPLALSMTKAMLNSSAGMSMADAVEREAVAQSLNFTTNDTAEAMLAFVQKRPPEFKGR